MHVKDRKLLASLIGSQITVANNCPRLKLGTFLLNHSFTITTLHHTTSRRRIVVILIMDVHSVNSEPSESTHNTDTGNVDPETAATTQANHKTPTKELPAVNFGDSSESTSTDTMNIAMPKPFTERESSPPMVLSPGLALDACPLLDRSVSTASSISSQSRRSSSSRLSDSGLSSAKRRGYMRPQATFVAESAKNRESVMSLGSIAHLQYYFARTGLLDGKGAQFAKDDPLGQRRKSSAPVSPSTSGMAIPEGSRTVSMGRLDTSSGAFLSTSPRESCAVSDGGFTDSPMDEEEDPDWEDGEMMLPPTVSTYNQRPIWVQPPPDLTMLRRELTEGLEDALKVLKETDKDKDGMFLYRLGHKSNADRRL